MKKESTICFRASKELHSSLVQVSREDRRSLSSTIAIILSDYLNKRKLSAYETRQEKRQYPRQVISAPAVIMQPGTQKEGIADITEISLGGLKIMLPKDLEDRLMIDGQGSKFEVVFNLPSSNKPIRLFCESKRFIDSKDSVHIGAAFVDPDIQHYKALQSYLM
jgi:hypothetical protein